MSEELIRLNVNVNQETAAALRASASRAGITYTEAIRRAIAILKYIEDQVDEGRMIQTMDSDGRNKRALVIL